MRTIRARARVIVAAAAVLAAWALAPAAAEATHGCRSSASSGADVFQITTHGVVFEKRSRFYGCLFSVGTVERLPLGFQPGSDLDWGYTRSPEPRMAGRYAIYGGFVSEGASTETPTYVIVHDLRIDRRLFLEPASSSHPPALSTFVVKANGSAAWIGSSQEAGATRYEVHKLGVDEGTGGAAMLDSDTDIPPLSLGLSRDRESIFWTNGNDARTAPLR